VSKIRCNVIASVCVKKQHSSFPKRLSTLLRSAINDEEQGTQSTSPALCPNLLKKFQRQKVLEWILTVIFGVKSQHDIQENN